MDRGGEPGRSSSAAERSACSGWAISSRGTTSPSGRRPAPSSTGSMPKDAAAGPSPPGRPDQRRIPPPRHEARPPLRGGDLREEGPPAAGPAGPGGVFPQVLRGADRGGFRRPYRTRHRPLPGAPEADRRRDRKRFSADRVSGQRPALSPRGPDRSDPALHRPGRVRPEGGQTGRDLLGDGQGAGEEVGPRGGRGAGLHLRRPGGDGPGGLLRPRPDLRRVLRLLRIRGDAGPGEGDRGHPLST